MFPSSSPPKQFLHMQEMSSYWENRDPAAYKLFANVHLKQEKIIRYGCSDVMKFPRRQRKVHEVKIVRCLKFQALKNKSSTTLYPNTQKSENCSLMLLSNLAEPEWIQINCEERIVASVLCIEQTPTKSGGTNKITSADRTCLVNQTAKKSQCFTFLWYNVTEERSFQEKCKEHNSIPVGMKDISNSLFLLDTITPSLGPFLSPHSPANSSNFHTNTYKKYLNKVFCEQKLVQRDQAEGFYICATNRVPVSFGSHMFVCKNLSYISSAYVCDGTIDCPNDDSDEVSCICSKLTANHPHKANITAKKNRMRSAFSYRNISGFCQNNVFLLDGSDIVLYVDSFSKAKNKLKNITYFVCDSGLKIDEVLMDDLVADCGPNGEDEPEMMSSAQYGNFVHCSEKDQVPCKEGHSKCYFIVDICTYKLDLYHHLFPCRSGCHLENCREFECNAMFKCLTSYCIPWSFVCDGKWDCPSGYDEFYSRV